MCAGSIAASRPVPRPRDGNAPLLVLGEPSQQSCAPFGCPWLLTEARPPLAGFQQVYDAGGFGTQPIMITAITFYARLDRPGTITPATYTFRLANTDARVGGLSRDRNQNLGRDAVVFWSGVLGGDVSDSFTITGTTPFPFDPKSGKNLLLDIGISGQPVAPRATPFGFFDRDIAGSAITSCALFVSDTNGFYNGSGFVTGFTLGPANSQAANQ